LGADFQTQKHDDAVHGMQYAISSKKDAEVVSKHPDGCEIPPGKVSNHVNGIVRQEQSL
jgi:hypothetical protein